MALFGIPLRTIGRIATGVGNVLSFAAVLVVPLLSKKDTIHEVRYNTVATYDDVIMAIMNSNMLSSDMSRATAVVPKDGDSTLYKAMINVINSNMLPSDKIDTIKHICKN